MTSCENPYTGEYAFLKKAKKDLSDPRKRARLAGIAYLRIAHPLHLLPGDKVLDIGCCLGTTGHFLKYLGVDTTGIDVNFAALRQGIQSWGKEGHNNRVAASTIALPFRDGIFKSVFSQDVLEHMTNEAELTQAFEQMCRVCAGPLMLHKITTLEDKKNIDVDPTHHIKWTESQWSEWFGQKGWRVTQTPSKHFPGKSVSYGNFLIERVNNTLNL